MSRPFFGRLLLCVATVLLVLATSSPAWGQHIQGRVSVTVLDPQGGVVPGAKLELRDLATNELRTGETQSAGTFSFVNLSPGKYKLSISKEGFETAAYDLTVAATKTTDVEATLKVGAITVTIEVGAVAPVTDVTVNAIGSVIDTRHIDTLPITGRDLTQLTRLVPGFGGTAGGAGTWNGLPSIAQGNTVDGVMGSPSRMKFGGNAQASVAPRLENIEEMTVQTDQLDLNQGFGTSSMQINFVTRRGSNDFHGSIYEDLRNSALNANNWYNNANNILKPQFKLNDFGGNIGGPIFKDKLFFYFSLATSRQPGSASRYNTFITSGAQAGNYTYIVGGVPQTVNLFTVAQSCNANPASCGITQPEQLAVLPLPTIVNSVIGDEFTRINQSLSEGSVGSTGSPILNSVAWVSLAPQTQWFPALRVDYTPTQKVRMNLALNRTKRDWPGDNLPFYPGDAYAKAAGGRKTDGMTAAYGFEWTISPTLINSFRAGYLYNVNYFDYNSSPEYKTNPQRVAWPLVDISPMDYYVPITSFYPVITASDTATWLRGGHTFNFGFSFYREQDHYWNPPELSNISLGLAEGDPAINALTNVGAYNPLPGADVDQQAEAQNLYALLTGRISGVTGSFPLDPATKQYIPERARAFNLNELSKAWALFFQDSWRVRPSLTINYGLRWDFTGDNHDLNNAYHNADDSSLYGPSGIGNLFKPGTLTGNLNPTLEARPHAYNSWNVSPQPTVGIAWVPRVKSGFLAKWLGEEGTVIRASFSQRNFTVPYQYFWNTASDYGSFFYQFYSLTAQNVPGAGNFPPGGLSLGQTFPPYALLPATYQEVASQSTFTFFNDQYSNGVNGIKFDIGQPYTQTWTVGIQRKLGQSRALEIRYSANRTRNQWISVDLNEVNVFENGFLQEFINAKSNYDICVANPAACTAAAGSAGPWFSNLGLPGQVAVPIFTGAFTGSTTGAQNVSSFRSGPFINYLNNGQVGTFAQVLTTVGAVPYFCNLVGSGFTPCAVNIGYTGPGAGYPINFFQVNPYATGIVDLQMTDKGWSNYQALQVDFRQRTWRGLQFDANYTWSHTLGVSTPNDWTGTYNQYTLRDLHNSYGPTLFDLRHVVHVSATYDLPFGRGKRFANQAGVVDKIVGGWTLGGIATYQTGFPFRVLGGYNTFNNFADGGVNLTGVSQDQLQAAVGVYPVPGQPRMSLINPQYRTIGIGANPAYITRNITPGTFTPPLWLHGPHAYYQDIMISKVIAITERWKFTFQSEFLNAFNHPVFGQGTNPVSANVRSANWATVTGASGAPRSIEFRAKISF